jgi:hypothetical protein
MGAVHRKGRGPLPFSARRSSGDRTRSPRPPGTEAEATAQRRAGSALSGVATATVLPVSSFAVTSTQCAGPTYLPTVVNAVNLALTDLGRPGNPLLSIPDLSSCSAPPAVLSPLLSASVTSEASPTGSASVSAQALGDTVVEESATVDTSTIGTVVLASPAPSVSFTVPYTTAGLTESGNAGLALVSFDGSANCADGSNSIWFYPPSQHDLTPPAPDHPSPTRRRRPAHARRIGR